MNFVHNGPIDEEYIARLADALNSLQPDEPFYHYICSTGGDMGCAQVAVELINTCNNPIYYTAFQEMSSAAFHIFFKIKCNRKIQKNTGSIMHQRYREGYINTNGKAKRSPYDVDELATIHRNMFKEDIKFLTKLGLSNDQLTIFKKGSDIFLSDKQLNKLLQNQTNGTIKGRKTTKGTRTLGTSSRSKGGTGRKRST